MTTPYMSFDDIDDGLRHRDEIMGAHDPNSPPIAVQDRTHGAGLPAVDRGGDGCPG